MKYRLVLSFLIFIGFLGNACDSKSEKAELKKPTTNREKAAAVGKVGDKILTKTLEKDLVGVVDSAKERAEMLDETSKDDY